MSTNVADYSVGSQDRQLKAMVIKSVHHGQCKIKVKESYRTLANNQFPLRYFTNLASSTKLSTSLEKENH